MSFTDHLENETNVAYTENGAITNRTTKSCLLDLFAMGGALRTREPKEIEDLFAKAFVEDKELALKMLFYLRDCRGGMGERRTFRTVIVWLANNYPAFIRSNIESIPFYGRWDDLLCLLDTPVKNEVIDLMSFTMSTIASLPQDKIPYDLLSLAKWLPSENASSSETKRFAKMIKKELGLSSQAYRKMLSKYRSILGIVERKMSKKEWKYIKYSAVPSRASLIYRKAFTKHDETRYLQYLADVKTGKQKINTKALYPYEIINPYLNYGSYNDETLNVMWDNQPDYTGEGENALVVADVSGSMMGDPMAVSISLAMYFAERNKNEAFKDTFITFSSKPSLQKIKGANLYEKVQYLMEAHWEMNTDLNAVFKLILNTAVKYSVPANELPSKIYIISDMEFDACVRGGNTMSNYKVIEEMYREAGYVMPSLVFWNVSSRNNQTPVTVDDNGTFLVSGLSPKIFESSMKSKALTAYDLMLDTITSERYKRVCLPAIIN